MLSLKYIKSDLYKSNFEGFWYSYSGERANVSDRKKTWFTNPFRSFFWWWKKEREKWWEKISWLWERTNIIMIKKLWECLDELDTSWDSEIQKSEMTPKLRHLLEGLGFSLKGSINIWSVKLATQNFLRLKDKAVEEALDSLLAFSHEVERDLAHRTSSKKWKTWEKTPSETWDNSWLRFFWWWDRSVADGDPIDIWDWFLVNLPKTRYSDMSIEELEREAGRMERKRRKGWKEEDESWIDKISNTWINIPIDKIRSSWVEYTPKWTTACSRTAKGNLSRIFWINTEWGMSTKIAYKRLWAPATPFPPIWNNIWDVWELFLDASIKNRKYWHRVSIFKNFGNRYVLDPYYKIPWYPPNTTEPILASDYLKFMQWTLWRNIWWAKYYNYTWWWQIWKYANYA